MRLRILLYLIIGLVIGGNVLAFPLKKLKIGERINIKKLQPVNIKGIPFSENGNQKIIFIWRHDKRLSKKTAKHFIRVCKERKVNCISVEMKNASKDIIERLLGSNIPNNFYMSKNPQYVKKWGIFTLPVTIFLNKKNEIIHAIGYEGQYVVKVERFLDLLEGKISKEEYEKLSSSPVDRKTSILPDLNYILKLIKDNQKDDAIKKLQQIKYKLQIKELNEFEKVRYAYVLIKLNKFNEALKVISNSKPNDIKAKFYKGVVLYKTGKIEESFNMFNSIVKIYPDKKAIYYYIGKIYKYKGDYKNAADYFEKAINYFYTDF